MHRVILQRTVAKTAMPAPMQLKEWAKNILKEKTNSAELTLRIVDKQEIQELNSTYRKKNKPTNVLSFPFDMPAEVEDETPILGDIVICADVVNEEAVAQNKTRDAHWAHMITHGILHLLGFDHEKDDDAEIMEAEEIRILKTFGFNNPYQ